MKPRVMLIGRNSPTFLALYERLRTEAGAEIVENRIVDLAEADVALRRFPDGIIAIFDLDAADADGLAVAEDLKGQLPNVRWLMASADQSPQTILRALRSGAEEFLPLPAEGAELAECLERMAKKLSAGAKNGQAVGKVVPVFSAQGGVGCTSIATNLAVSLASRHYSVCIVDLVLQFGSVTSFLDLTPSFTIVDFAQKLERFDPLLLEGSLVDHTSGVRVLAEPFRAEEATGISSSDIARILDTLTRSFQFVIVDMPKEIDEVRLPALEKASAILFPLEMNVPSIKRTQRALRMIERLGIPLQKVLLVPNRHLNDRVITFDSLEKTLGKGPFWTLPNDYVTAQSAINQGVPVVELNPGSALAKAYGGLSSRLLDELGVGAGAGREANGKRGGLFGWMQRALPGAASSVH